MGVNVVRGTTILAWLFNKSPITNCIPRDDVGRPLVAISICMSPHPRIVSQTFPSFRGRRMPSVSSPIRRPAALFVGPVPVIFLDSLKVPLPIFFGQQYTARLASLVMCIELPNLFVDSASFAFFHSGTLNRNGMSVNSPLERYLVVQVGRLCRHRMGGCRCSCFFAGSALTRQGCS